jgi:orotidine-5'-phosphate decarboxylase
VVGATHPERVFAIREKSGQMPFLIPGIGAQGGALKKTLEAVQDGTRVPCLINASRSILYPEKSSFFNEFKETQEFSSKDCISSSRHAAHKLHQEIRNCLEK